MGRCSRLQWARAVFVSRRIPGGGVAGENVLEVVQEGTQLQEAYYLLLLKWPKFGSANFKLLYNKVLK